MHALTLFVKEGIVGLLWTYFGKGLDKEIKTALVSVRSL